MNRPEYWQDDETWAAYEEWQQHNPPAKYPPLVGLAAVIAKARGFDIEASIKFLNEMSRIICDAGTVIEQGTGSLEPPIVVLGTQPQASEKAN